MFDLNEIKNAGDLLAGLHWASQMEAEARKVKVFARAWCNERGPLEDESTGKTWGPAESVSEGKITMGLADALGWLEGLGLSRTQLDRAEAELRDRGCGEKKTITRYSWRRA